MLSIFVLLCACILFVFSVQWHLKPKEPINSAHSNKDHWSNKNAIGHTLKKSEPKTTRYQNVIMNFSKDDLEDINTNPLDILPPPEFGIRTLAKNSTTISLRLVR